MGRKQIVKRNYDNEGKLVSKECGKCHEIKPVSEFSKDIYNSDRLQSKCKECLKECNKKRYQENPDYFKKHNKKYYQENTNYIKENKRKN